MPADDKLTPKEIAKLDAEEYDEPGRDLLATRPAPEGGDVESPAAQEGVPGSIGSTKNKFGSDEQNRLAKGKNA